MRTYSESRRLPHPADSLYAIITDVENYREFLPWCVASRVRQRHANFMIADLVIGYGAIRETFTSKVELDPQARTVRSTQQSGPFRHLESLWTISVASQDEAVVDFAISFEFKSFLLEKLIGAVFDRAARSMVEAFEKRAAVLLAE